MDGARVIWGHGERGRARFLVVGHYGAPNVGDEAMLYGLLSGLGHRSDLAFLVSARDGRLPRGVGSFAHVSVCRRGFARDLVRVLVLRNVIWGGGSHLHDAPRGRALVHHIGSIGRFAAVSLVARLRGGHVLWLGMGVGPFRHKGTRRLAGLAARVPTAIVVRDGRSRAELATIAPGVKATLGFDLAALLPPAPDRRASAERSRTRVLGFAPVGSPKQAQMGGPEDFDAIARGVASLSGDLHVVVRLFCFCGGGPYPDRPLVSALASRWESRFGLVCDVVDTPDDPIGVIASVSECDAMIAVRFHSLMFAFLVGTPALALCYHEKVRQLAVDIDLPEDLVFDWSEIPQLETGKALRRVLTDSPDCSPRLTRPAAVERAGRNLDALNVAGTGAAR